MHTRRASFRIGLPGSASRLNDRLYALVDGQLTSERSSTHNVTLCDVPSNGVASWARGVKALGMDLASYVGLHFSHVLRSDRPEARHNACVHQRLVDRKGTACKRVRYAKQLTEDLREDRWDRWLRVGADQCPTTDAELNLTSFGLKRRYPGLKRVLVACDSGDSQRDNPTASKALRRKASEMGFDEVRCGIRATADTEPMGDLDLEYMARNCKVVVAAHSTFSLMSIVLGHGMVDHARRATFYSPEWSGAVAAGLFTHFDRSGVRSVRSLFA